MPSAADRRRGGTAVAGVAAGALLLSIPLPSHAVFGDVTAIDLGPAAVGTAVNGAELVGDTMFLVSRQAVPANLSTLDLTTRTVTDVTTIPSGIEGWAATAVNDGADLYFGMHTPADIYHYDIEQGALTTEPVATLPAELLVMDQSAAPDDTIYIAGMARGASGGVYELDPATNEVEPLGTPVEGQRYVRSIVANDETVFAGMGPAASVAYRDRDGGEWQTMDIPELEGESFVYDIALEGQYLTFGTEPSGLFGVVDLETSDVTIVPVPDGRTIDSIVMDGTTAYFTVRPEGALYSYDISTGSLTKLGVPSIGAEHRKLFVSDGTVIGVTGVGDVWSYSMADGTVDVISGLESGMPRSPERGAQSLAVFQGDAYVAGHWGIQQHDGTSGSSERFAVPGETKTMTADDQQLFASIYPASQVWTYDPESTDLEFLAQIRDNQMRPRTSLYNHTTGKLLVGTRETYGNVGGAVSVIDPATGAIETHRDLVVDQTPISLAAIDGTAFVGHEILGEVHAPTTTEADLISWDIETATTNWDIVPVPDAAAISGLATYNTADGPRLYGLTTTGWLFEVDPATGELLGSVKAGSRATDLVANDVGVFALINGGIFRIDTEAGDLSRQRVHSGAFTHIAVDDTDPFRIYAVGIRTVDGVSQARLYAVEMEPTVSVIRWSVTDSDGDALGGSTFRVIAPDDSEVTVDDNGPLDTDPDTGEIAYLSDQFGHHKVQQREGASGYLLDRGTQHARSSMEQPAPDELTFTNRTHPGKKR
ncbi:hypothetical protein [Tessaracoccus flavus]|uniref:Uncharacterized protein n=1 Tax=Tessaracoccus flavus TaxID=1610493 RepID=A0A1Q2CFT4_9ACTN|nr:hypothetical protein [Tessaracoccus flavus]AQP44976.1 hypothetical protein RPIT_09420 [Tessaracoccus flavus]SDY60356.1 hypothetical protein SAMN05428934_102423 [Tessaracoccus flavus]